MMLLMTTLLQTAPSCQLLHIRLFETKIERVMQAYGSQGMNKTHEARIIADWQTSRAVIYLMIQINQIGQSIVSKALSF